jgi:hypothetical protein
MEILHDRELIDQGDFRTGKSDSACEVFDRADVVEKVGLETWTGYWTAGIAQKAAITGEEAWVE